MNDLLKPKWTMFWGRLTLTLCKSNKILVRIQFINENLFSVYDCTQVARGVQNQIFKIWIIDLGVQIHI